MTDTPEPVKLDPNAEWQINAMRTSDGIPWVMLSWRSGTALIHWQQPLTKFTEWLDWLNVERNLIDEKQKRVNG